MKQRRRAGRRAARQLSAPPGSSAAARQGRGPCMCKLYHQRLLPGLAGSAPRQHLFLTPTTHGLALLTSLPAACAPINASRPPIRMTHQPLFFSLGFLSGMLCNVSFQSLRLGPTRGAARSGAALCSLEEPRCTRGLDAASFCCCTAAAALLRPSRIWPLALSIDINGMEVRRSDQRWRRKRRRRECHNSLGMLGMSHYRVDACRR